MQLISKQPIVTGQIPSQQQADDLVKDLAERSVIPPTLEKVIDSFREQDSLCGSQDMMIRF